MNLHGKDIKIFTANSNPQVAADIAKALGLPLGQSEVVTFSDGEVSVSIKESVRGSDVFVVQSTAGRITAVIPYMGYARQDRKAKARDPISAKLMADLLTVAGADRILTMDLHCAQIQGFFNIPVDHLLGVPILVPYFVEKFKDIKDNTIIVSPDLGSVTRARNFAAKFDAPLAIVDKRRQKANVCEVMNIIGDVKDKDVILVDDMIDTAGTLCNAAKAIMEKGGARSVTACATHGVLSGPAIERIQASVIKEVVILDTIALPPEKHIDKITVLPVAPVFAQAIERIYADRPISPLFNN